MTTARAIDNQPAEQVANEDPALDLLLDDLYREFLVRPNNEVAAMLDAINECIAANTERVITHLLQARKFVCELLLEERRD